MTTQAPAHVIAVTVASNGNGRPASVTVTGPAGQWRAAVNPRDPMGFVDSILEAVRAQLVPVALQFPESWPSESVADAQPALAPDVARAAAAVVHAFGTRDEHGPELAAHLLDPMVALDEALTAAGSD